MTFHKGSLLLVSAMVLYGTSTITTEASTLSGHHLHEGGIFLRPSRGGPSDGCGPNPLAKLALLLEAITGEDLTAEDVSWHLQKDPQLMREMLVLLQFRQYHNCMTTGEGMRF